jgi:hypothetical protein
MPETSKRQSRLELIKLLDTLWLEYPQHLRELPEKEQARFVQQQGYARAQDLLAHLGAWMEESRRVMPYLLHAEKPPRDYGNDAQFNARAVERWAAHSRVDVEAWYEQQRLALKQLVLELPDEAFEQPRVYRWLVGTIVEHYEEHPLS